MNLIISIVRLLVGSLFIFSGLVKANDPLGLSYKMEEFFEVWSIGLSEGSFFLKHPLISLFGFLHDHSLLLAVLMIGFEIIAGAALLLGWRMKFFGGFLVLLIVFFTFLTGYAVFSRHPDGSPKFTNCGCFGDCLPITPMTSFSKDLVLALLILFLYYFRKKITPVFPGRVSTRLMLAVVIASFAFQGYTLAYLPVVDCLPFKKGNSISEQMQPPPGSVTDSFAIRFIYEKEGKEYEFSPTDLPADFQTYTYKDRIDKLVRKGNAEPAIKSFSLSGETNIDSTGIILSQPYAVLLFCLDFSTPVSKWEKAFAEIYTELKNKHIPAYLVTTNTDAAKKETGETAFNDIPLFKCDFTAIRTAARTNPCLYLLQEGVIAGKWSGKRLKDIRRELDSIAPQPSTAPGETNLIITADSTTK